MNGTAGICTGTVFCGAIGSASRAEYCVTGDCINLAARLMGKAKINRVLCDTNSFSEAEATSNEISFTKLDKIKVKGKDEPIDVYEPKHVTVFDRWTGNSVSSDSSSAGNENPLSKSHNNTDPFRVVGNAEQKEALGRLQFTSKSPAKAVIIEGIRGQGKTCMAEWAAQVSDADHVFTSRAESSENHTPFFVWRPILLNILMIESEKKPQENSHEQKRKEMSILDEIAVDEHIDEFDEDLPGPMKRSHSVDKTAGSLPLHADSRSGSMSLHKATSPFTHDQTPRPSIVHSRNQMFRVQSFPDNLPEQKKVEDIALGSLDTRPTRTGTVGHNHRPPFPGEIGWQDESFKHGGALLPVEF